MTSGSTVTALAAASGAPAATRLWKTGGGRCESSPWGAHCASSAMHSARREAARCACDMWMKSGSQCVSGSFQAARRRPPRHAVSDTASKCAVSFDSLPRPSACTPKPTRSSSGPVFSWKHCSSWASQKSGACAASLHAGTALARAARSGRRTQAITTVTTPSGHSASRAMRARAAPANAGVLGGPPDGRPGPIAASALHSVALAKGLRQSGQAFTCSSNAQGRWYLWLHTSWPAASVSRASGRAQGAPRSGPWRGASSKFPRQMAQESSGQSACVGAAAGASSHSPGSGNAGQGAPPCTCPQRHRKPWWCDTSMPISPMRPRGCSQASQRLFLMGLYRVHRGHAHHCVPSPSKKKVCSCRRIARMLYALLQPQ
mmetsp:Transcript_3283/g.10212  ORF Transcript_3283/g.10212 Transcript_3283/m.10212 type:complete len:374 (+) Transcript_3283:1360-2481(+)